MVALPSLCERSPDRRVQRLWQPLGHVASLMNLATLDRRVGTEGPPNDLAQRLGAVDDEQSADLRVEPALDQIVDQRLHDGGILGRRFDQGEWMFAAVGIDPERGD